MWKHAIVTFKCKVLHARRLIVFSFTPLVSCLEVRRGKLISNPGRVRVMTYCSRLLNTTKAEPIGPKHFTSSHPFLSPPLYLLSAEDAERRNVMKGMEESEGSVY